MKFQDMPNKIYLISLVFALGLTACAGDPMVSGVDPFAPSIFKEGAVVMPSSPPNKATTLPFYVTNTTVFKFAIDTNSIVVGTDGVTRYIVIITNPSGENQVQYEGIRCDSFQWRLYGTFENGAWRENPLSEWRDIKFNIPNRYQAALAQGAFCNISSQEKNISVIQKSLNPNNFIGGGKPSNSFGVIY